MSTLKRPTKEGPSLTNSKAASSAQTISIGSVIADCASMELKSVLGISSVEPKVMALLSILAEEPGRVWSREELINRIWGQADVGDENLTRTVYLLRKALRTPHRLSDAIKTISKRGYQLRGVRPEPTKSSLNSKPADRSLAVLPFTDMSQQGNSELLADGLCLDLTNLLSRVPSFIVAPHSSAERARRNGTDLYEQSSSLAVRFLVSGSFLRLGQQIRIRAELFDQSAGGTVWSKKYDTELDAFFGVQDNIALSIATTISAEVKVSALKPLFKRPKFDLSVYELLQAAEAERWVYNRRAVRNIIGYLNSALELAPDNAEVQAALAVQFAQNLVHGWAGLDVEETKARAYHHLSAAQAIDPTHPDILAAAGIFYVMSARNDVAIPYLERSSSLNPNDPHVRALLGWQKCIVDFDESQLELIRSAERDAPYHPRFAIWANYRAHGELRLGRFEAALAAFEESAVRDPNYPGNLFVRAVPLVLMGRHREATEKIAEALRQEPAASADGILRVVDQNAFAHPRDMDMQDFEQQFRAAWPG